jgi:SWI/SNF-related matrix-associated actin-dependent regulator 1 of chromatin subfamily A
MIRRRKKDVLKDLPEKTRFTIPIECPQIREYQHADRDFRGWMLKHQGKTDTAFRAELSDRSFRAEAMVQMGHLKRLAAQIKLRDFMEWGDNFLEASDDKIIIFAIHKKIIASLRERYGKLAVVIDGSTSESDRRLYAKRFNESRGTRIMIGQLQATGIGWNGTAASTVAFAELGWTPGEHGQAEDRIHRIGQKKKSFCYYFVAKDTIEERLCKLIQEKQKVLDSVLDGKTVSDFNIYDRLLEQYRKAA